MFQHFVITVLCLVASSFFIRVKSLLLSVSCICNLLFFTARKKTLQVILIVCVSGARWGRPGPRRKGRKKLTRRSSLLAYLNYVTHFVLNISVLEGEFCSFYFFLLGKKKNCMEFVCRGTVCIFTHVVPSPLPLTSDVHLLAWIVESRWQHIFYD